ncbi:hypothetical protein [Sphingomonas sp. T1]|uniref:hypothetical protein n=1 Tax=Sphingomonas sp. T1 TaxID=2653172 RepID=UPI001F1CE26D|nr:hypothetical protein [Sphingomonas sp. T1]
MASTSASTRRRARFNIAKHEQLLVDGHERLADVVIEQISYATSSGAMTAPWPSRLAVERLEMFADSRQVDEPVD